jgi:phospholipase D1/2
VICGSANLNDRSQLGYHDSEIAVVIEDPSPVDSLMAGKPYQASKYAASLRRQLFRKHLGLLPWQDWTKPDANFMPVDHAPNIYDWNSRADRAVVDPLSYEFEELWNETAKVNTDVFAKAFHCVPDDRIRDWGAYEKFYQDLYVGKFPGKADDRDKDKPRVPPRYRYGHVAKEEFPGGVRELKEWLARVRGTLVEMPLRFMENVDFAQEGLKLNPLTDTVYT